jgi:hypothetical protein
LKASGASRLEGFEGLRLRGLQASRLEGFKTHDRRTGTYEYESTVRRKTKTSKSNIKKKGDRYFLWAKRKWRRRIEPRVR